MIEYVIAAAILVSVILLIVCSHIDWRSVNDYNSGYYNEDGDYIYYDRKLIRYKRRHQTENKH